MKKLGGIVCDKCRRFRTDGYITFKGKKRELQYCKQCGRERQDLELIDTFHKRLKKIGIEVELGLNVPCVYLERINGKEVTEVFESEHSFTVAWFPVNVNNKACFSNIKEIFKLIRKYV